MKRNYQYIPFLLNLMPILQSFFFMLAMLYNLRGINNYY